MRARGAWQSLAVAAGVAIALGGCADRGGSPAAGSAPVLTTSVVDGPAVDSSSAAPNAPVPDIDQSAYVSGGFAAQGAGGVGTVGYGWVVEAGSVLGRITVDHLVRDTARCTPDNGSSTCVVVSVRTDRADGFAGDHGDSGAAASTYNEDGTIKDLPG